MHHVFLSGMISDYPSSQTLIIEYDIKEAVESGKLSVGKALLQKMLSCKEELYSILTMVENVREVEVKS